MDGTNPSKPGLSSAGAINIKSEYELSDTRRTSTSEDVTSKHGTGEREGGFFPSPGLSGSVDVDVPGERVAIGRMDQAKIASMHHIVDTAVSVESKQRINQLVAQVETLTATEKLLLYLRLPTGSSSSDPLKQPLNPLGSRSEIQQTVNWIQTHLEVDPDVSLPKQDVYDEYISFAMNSNMKPLSTADFGKVMKQVYPTVRPRRLGTRGNSRYCYAGLSKKIKLEIPQLPEITEKPKSTSASGADIDASSNVIKDWAGKVLGVKFDNLQDLAKHLWTNNMVETSSLPLSPNIHSFIEDIESAPTGETEQRQRGVIKQLKRKIQASPGRPKKGKPEEILPPVSSPPSGIPPPAAPDPYAFPGPYLPLQPYETRPPPYLLYQPPARAAHAHPDYSDPYKFDPYRREPLVQPELSPRYAHGTSNVPINLSSDAIRPASYYREQKTTNTSLDLTTPVKQEPPSQRPLQTKLPLPGKKMILEAYQHESQAASPQQPALGQERAGRGETEVVGYLPKKMRAAEIAGGKLRAHTQQQASSSKEPPPPVKEERNEPGTFFEDPKNVTCRSRNETAALVPSDVQQGGAAVRQARGRPRKTSPTKAKYVKRKPRNAAPQPPQQDTCCGLDGINFKTGIICEENHLEILNRERVSSISGLDKHALDDYLNEGSSQEHEEELMQYFHDAKAKPAETKQVLPFLEEPPEDQSDAGDQNKIDQLREILVKNLKNHSRSASPQKPVDPASQEKADQANEKTHRFKSIAGPNINEPVAKHDAHVATSHTKFFPQLEQTNNMSGVSGAEPPSPTTRVQQYDFVPISPSNISPRAGNLSIPFKDCNLTRVKANGTASLTAEMSPFVSPRNTPVPRSKAAQKPMPNKICRRRTTPNCCLSLTGQQNFAVPNEQNFAPKSPGYNVLLRQPPMSAPPSPNIHSAFYHQQFNCFPPVNGIPNGQCNQLTSPQTEQRNGECNPSTLGDSLSCEVSQLFLNGSQRQDADSFRSQSAPLNKNFFPDDGSTFDNYRTPLTYSITTPSHSVPPTPVPQEFCDFGSFSETCESISQGLNSESLSKIYNVIDSSEEMLNTATIDDEPLGSLLDKETSFAENLNRVFNGDDDLVKRTLSLDYELSEVIEKSKIESCYSRSVPSTPLPYRKGVFNNFALSNNICKNLTPQLNACDSIESKSVPSTPMLLADRTSFTYNRDYLINGNTLGVVNTMNSFDGDDLKEVFLNVNGRKNDVALIEGLQESPLEEILQGTLHSELQNFATQGIANEGDIMADFDKIGNQPYGVI